MTKKILSFVVVALLFISCDKAAKTPNTPTAINSKEFKSAYISTTKLMEESLEAKDIEAKYKGKAKQMDGKLKGEVAKLEAEKKSFQSNAQKNGEAWAQQKYGELQQRDQQLQYAQQGMLQQLQQESGVELDSLVSKYKRVFKNYGKEKGYDYLFGTGEVSSVLYAKDGYDVTNEIIKIVNEKYKDSDKKEENTEKK